MKGNSAKRYVLAAPPAPEFGGYARELVRKTPAAGKRLLLYGILGNPVPAGELGPGVQGQTLSLIPVPPAGLWAVVSQLPESAAALTTATAASTAADAFDYDRVLRALHLRMPLLPMPYGAALTDAAAVCALLTDRAAAYHALLALLAGCDEYGVRAFTLPEPLPVHAVRVDAGLAAAEALAARVGVALGPLSCAQLVQCRPSPSMRQPTTTMSLSFLVPRAQEASFRHAFLELKREEVLPMWLSGPWLPYSFAGETAVS